MTISLSLDEYQTKEIPVGIRIVSLNPEEIVYGLGHYNNNVYFEGESYVVIDYILEKDHIDLLFKTEGAV